MTDVNLCAAPQKVNRKFDKIDPDVIEMARAVPIRTVVAAVVPLNRQGFGLCPFHSERTPSFHADVKRNRWKCWGCGMGGDTIAFVGITENLDFVSSVKRLTGGAFPMPKRAHLARTPRTVEAVATPQFVLDLWRKATEPRLAELYLFSRGIRVRPKPLPEALRGHNRVRCSETGEYRPAVLAALCAPDGSITALQRIWVSTAMLIDRGISPPKGTRATDLVAGKKTIGQMGAGAVRLAPPGPTLGIAEGIETALSAAEIFRIPCWASLGASRLGAIELPAGVKHVLVMGDNGAAGEAAAAAAVTAYRRRGYQAESVFPERGAADFNEQLIGSL